MLTTEHLDVLIVGAGLSGIGAGFHLQAKCPGKSYAILEARDCIGGTWDLFRYPGIRSDSDMYTLGYSFRPGRNRRRSPTGRDPQLRPRDRRRDGIDRKIRFHHRVKRASWSTPDANGPSRWRGRGPSETRAPHLLFPLHVQRLLQLRGGYTPDLRARALRRPHRAPAEWTDDIEFAGKRVVVIGTGPRP